MGLTEKQVRGLRHLLLHRCGNNSLASYSIVRTQEAPWRYELETKTMVLESNSSGGTSPVPLVKVKSVESWLRHKLQVLWSGGKLVWYRFMDGANCT